MDPRKVGQHPCACRIASEQLRLVLCQLVSNTAGDSARIQNTPTCSRHFSVDERLHQVHKRLSSVEDVQQDGNNDVHF